MLRIRKQREKKQKILRVKYKGWIVIQMQKHSTCYLLVKVFISCIRIHSEHIDVFLVRKPEKS